jgi:hypothetical protein
LWIIVLSFKSFGQLNTVLDIDRPQDHHLRSGLDNLLCNGRIVGGLGGPDDLGTRSRANRFDAPR